MGLEAALIGGSVASSLFSSSQGNAAADAQLDYYNDALDLQERMYDDSMEMIEPFYDASLVAIEPYLNTLGIYATDPGLSIEYVGGTGGSGGSSGSGDSVGVFGDFFDDVGGMDLDAFGIEAHPANDGFFTDLYNAGYLDSDPSAGSSGSSGGYYMVGDQQFGTYEDAQKYLDSQSWENRGFEESDAYLWNLEQGQDAIDAHSSAGGTRLSGETLEEAMAFSQGLASNEHYNYQNQLAGLMGLGTTTTNQGVAAGQNYANAATNLYTASGDAKASGYENTANAFNAGIGNLSSYFMYDAMGMFG